MSIDSIQSAYAEIQTFLMSKGSQLSAEVRDKLLEVSSNPIAPLAITEAAEVIYSARGTLKASVKPTALELALDLFSFALFNVWLGLQDGRGNSVMNTLHRELGHTPISGTWPDPAEDVAPLEKFDFTPKQADAPAPTPGE